MDHSVYDIIHLVSEVYALDDYIVDCMEVFFENKIETYGNCKKVILSNDDIISLQRTCFDEDENVPSCNVILSSIRIQVHYIVGNTVQDDCTVYNIEIVFQILHSPYTNVLDLGVCISIQTAVERRDFLQRCTIKALVNTIMKTWESSDLDNVLTNVFGRATSKWRYRTTPMRRRYSRMYKIFTFHC